ncbi:unnamed protein product [Durusdinium trenchii]|uniref:Uncharacterized protein n=1 Tax=Durusdinium trenchii TaxID=1381693 RepID=A0ABP0R532_9DINO
MVGWSFASYAARELKSSSVATSCQDACGPRHDAEHSRVSPGGEMLRGVVMLPLVTFFLLNFLGRAVTAFMNPLCQCSTRRFLCSGQRCLQLMAFILYFAHLAT